MTIPSAALEQGLLDARVRSHRALAPGAMTATALVCLLTASLLWATVPGPAVLSWAACLALAHAWRAAVPWAHDRALRRGELDDAQGRLWLRRYRVSFAVHGLAWGLGSLLMPPLLSSEQLPLFMFVVAGMAAGSLIATPFDLRASMGFVVPALAPLVVRLPAAGDDASRTLGAVLVLLVVIAGINGRRAQRLVLDTVRLRQQQEEHISAARAHARDAEQARQALAEQHHLMAQLMQGTPQGYWLIDNAGVNTDVNPAMCEMLGRPREQIVGRNVREFFGDDDLATLQRELQTRQEGRSGGYEIGITRPDGSRLHCVNHATPIRDTAGRIVGSVGLWTDISVRRRAELALRTYEVVANSITDMVSVVGEDLVYRMVNDAWCHALGVPRDQALGRRTTDVLPAGGTPLRLQMLRECIEQRRTRTARATSLIPGLAGRMLETTYYPYAEDAAGMPCVVMVTRDVTDQDAARAALEAGAEYLRRTLNATGDAIFASDTHDPQLPVRFVNEQMLQMWGIPAERGPTLTPADIMAYALPQMQEPQAEAALIASIIAGGLRHESRVQLRDGRTLLRRCVPAELGGSALRVWSFRDITAEIRALQLVQRNEAEQRALLDAFPGYIARLDTGLIFRYANRGLASLLGMAPEAVIGRTAAELLGTDYAAPLQAVAQRALAGTTSTFEYAHPGGQGRPAAELQVTLTVGVDPGSGAPALYGFGVDIGARRRAERALRESEAELRALLAAFPGYIAAVDEQGRYTYVNQRSLALLGRPAQQVIGQPMQEVLGPQRSVASLAAMARARAGERVVVHTTYPAGPSGEPLALEVTHVAGGVLTDGRQNFYAFGVDVSARRQAEEALIMARDEAERANRAKSQFLAQMSHELRTPMNAILGFGQLLATDTRHGLPAHQQAWVGEILRGARHLLELINEVLDLGRIEAGQLHVEPVPVELGDLAQECLALVRPLATGHGVQLLPPDPALATLRVRADRTRLKQVLLNLLGNAIKYNRSGGTVELQGRAEPDALVWLAVRDNGRGLSGTEQQRLFQPFERLHAAGSGVEGTGIGLALSRRLVEAMHGSIGVHSELGTGCTFWLRLPAAEDAAARAAVPALAAPTATPEQAAQSTVLYIEDNPVNVELMEAMLGRLGGVRLVSATLPSEGLRLAAQERPALILLDIQLPEMDGFEVLGHLRAQAALKGTPVIAVSANALQTDIDAAKAAGFADYLTKPLNLELLLATVRGALTTAAARPA